MTNLRSVVTEGDIETIKAKYKDKIKAAKGIGETVTETPPEDRLSAMSKFIPGESVAIFIGVFGLLGSALETTPIEWVGFITFIFCLVLAIYITYSKASSEKVQIAGLDKPVEVPGKYWKTALTAGAFIIWAINIEGFLAIIRGAVPLWDPVFGQILILIYTALIPEFYSRMSKPKS